MSTTSVRKAPRLEPRSVIDQEGARPTGVWHPVREPGSLTQRIVGAIEGLLGGQDLSPGSRLPPERELAALLGVSRPALREALKVLEARGRLTIRHGQGVFVRSRHQAALQVGFWPIEASLDELFAMREVLEEPAAAWTAASATEAEITQLDAALAAVADARRPPVDFQRLAKLDAAFHMLIVELAKNRFLRQTLDVLQEILATGMETTLTIPERLARSQLEHEAIFRAIARGDAGAARLAVRKHIRGARDAALSRLGTETTSKEGDVGGHCR